MGLVARIARREAEAAIRQLVARYGFAIDDRDFFALSGLFADDAVVRAASGAFRGDGRDAIVATYRAQLGRLGVSGHYMHDVLLDLADVGRGKARGRITAHAELWRRGRSWIIALRYADRYRRIGEDWRIAERVIDVRYDMAIRPIDQAEPDVMARGNG